MFKMFKSKTKIYTASVNSLTFDIIITKNGDSIELQDLNFDSFDEAINYAKWKMQLLESQEISRDIKNKVISELVSDFIKTGNNMALSQLQLFLFLFKKLTADKKRMYGIYELIDTIEKLGINSNGYIPF